MGTAAALLALAVTVVAVAGTPGAVATQGSPVVAGSWNAASTTTTVSEVFSAPGTCPSAETGSTIEGLVGCGHNGLEGFGTNYGVWGSTTGSSSPAILGTNTGGGDGIQGATGGAGASAVYGHNTSGGPVAKGVFGSATGGGTGVRGESASGHGVEGASTSGTGVYASGATALQVVGKAKFSRSGITTIAAGASSKTISLAGVTTASMVLATSQQSSSVFVRSAVPASGSFTIRLSGAAPTGGLKVAYFVLN
jgi:hypothetical protein